MNNNNNKTQGDTLSDWLWIGASVLGTAALVWAGFWWVPSGWTPIVLGAYVLLLVMILGLVGSGKRQQ